MVHEGIHGECGLLHQLHVDDGPMRDLIIAYCNQHFLETNETLRDWLPHCVLVSGEGVATYYRSPNGSEQVSHLVNWKGFLEWLKD